jgi:O-antigen/teichoic acid export membrane protein
MMSSIVPMSTNDHQKIAVAQLFGAIGSLVLLWFLVARYGNSGAALALFAPEVWMCCVVLPAAFKQVRDTPRDFIAEVLRMPRLFHRRLTD